MTLFKISANSPWGNLAEERFKASILCLWRRSFLEGRHATMGSTRKVIQMYINERIHCQCPMKKQFYKSSEMPLTHADQEINAESVCFYSGLECDEMSPPGAQLLAKSTKVFPLCIGCANKGKKHQHGEARTTTQTRKCCRAVSESDPEEDPLLSGDSSTEDESNEQSDNYRYNDEVSCDWSDWFRWSSKLGGGAGMATKKMYRRAWLESSFRSDFFWGSKYSEQDTQIVSPFA